MSTPSNAAATGRVLGVIHTGFTISNMERSLAFYRDQLGMVVVGEQEIGYPYLGQMVGLPDVRMKQVFVKVTPEAEHFIELLEYVSHPAEPTPRETNRPGNGHICLRVADIDALYARLQPQGVVFMAPPTTITHGINRGARATYMRDPDGFTVELFQPAT